MYLPFSIAFDSFTKETKFPPFLKKIKLLKWVRNTDEGGKAEGLI